MEKIDLEDITMKLIQMYFSFFLLVMSPLFAQEIVNGNFDLGRNNGWVESSQGNYTLISTAASFTSSEITPAVPAHSGQYMARIGGYGYEINAISQTVTLPNTTPLYLKLYVQDRNSTTSECAGLWVGAEIKVIVSGEKIFDTYLCHYNQTESWIPIYFDFTAGAGKTVQIIFRAEAANSVWSFLYIDDVSLTNTITDVGEKSQFPIKHELAQNYPNPFNPITTIPFSIEKNSFVNVAVVDLLGRQIAKLVSKNLTAGKYNTTWDATGFPSGVYAVRMEVGNVVTIKRMILLK